MLEGLSNITMQTYYPLCGHKKLNKVDGSRKFSILKRGIGIEGEKLWKQVRGKKFGNKSENGNRLNVELSVYYI